MLFSTARDIIINLAVEKNIDTWWSKTSLYSAIYYHTSRWDQKQHNILLCIVLCLFNIKPSCTGDVLCTVLVIAIKPDYRMRTKSNLTRVLQVVYEKTPIMIVNILIIIMTIIEKLIINTIVTTIVIMILLLLLLLLLMIITIIVMIIIINNNNNNNNNDNTLYVPC